MLEAAAPRRLFPCENSVTFDRNTFSNLGVQGGDRVCFLQIGLFSQVEENMNLTKETIYARSCSI
jgi:hypothetical protein